MWKWMGVAFAATLVFMAVGQAISWWVYPDSVQNRGAFGDSFAPIVGVISALALGAAVLSVFLQRKELRLQRQELRENRRELAKQAESLASQAAAMTQQVGALNEQALQTQSLVFEIFHASQAADRHHRAQIQANLLAARAELQRWTELGSAKCSEGRWPDVMARVETGLGNTTPVQAFFAEHALEARRLCDAIEKELRAHENRPRRIVEKL